MRFKTIKYFVFVMILTLVCSVATFARQAAAEVRNDSEIDLPNYSAGEGITLDGLITDEIVTFEARIKLAADGTANSSGNCYGVIFGNYSEKNTACALNFEVRENGNPSVLVGETYYTFGDVNLRTGEWINFAVIIDRDGGKMSAYIDGEEKQTLASLTFSRSLSSADKFSVGRDTRTTGNYADSFFMGDIERISVFSDERTVAELIADAISLPAYSDDKNLIYAESYALNERTEVQRDGNIYYAEDSFKKVPNTFEAWINIHEDLPDNVYGGVIFGNSRGVNSEELGTVNYEIGKYGHLLLKWNKRQLEYEFRKADLRSGTWTHIAVVHDESDDTWSYYVNGELNEKTVCVADSNVSGYSYAVGCDFTNGKGEQKTPLYGDIRQITVYSEPISEQRVKADMSSEDIYGGNGYDLLANWYFGDCTSAVVYDTSKNGTDMYKGTVDTFSDTFDTVNDDFEYDYSFVVIPDTQNMVDAEYKGYDHLIAISEWIKDNAQSQKIRFAMHMGDFVNTPKKNGAENTEEWSKAKDAMQILNGVIPYSVIPGNHDYDNMWVNRDLTIFNKYFGENTYNPMDTEIYYYEDGKMENTYHKFSADGVKYLVFALEFGVRTDVLEWADKIAYENEDSRIIVTTHAFITEHGVYDQDTGAAPRTYGFTSAGDSDYVNNGKAIWDKFISRHSNIFMVLNGHYSSDDIIRKTYYGTEGNKVNAMFINAQSMLDCNEGMIAILKVNEKTNQISVNYYNPYRGEYYNEQNQFTFSFADNKNPTVKGEDKTVYTVKYETYGGNEFRDTVVESGETVEIEYVPVKDGFMFEGWYTDEAFDQKLSDNKLTANRDVVLYAKWRDSQTLYFVAFDCNGGSEISVRSVEKGSLVIRPNDPVKSGYIFKGWYKDEALAEKWNFSTDRTDGNLTLYAKWQKVEIPVGGDSSDLFSDSENGGCSSAVGTGIEVLSILLCSVAVCIKRKK